MLEPDTKTEQMRKVATIMNVEQYILDYINVLRLAEAQPPPPEVAAFNEKYTETCRKRAEAEYKEHGRWFYCEDRKEFRGNIRWDECVTYRIYWQLYTRYGSLDKIPNYSEVSAGPLPWL